MLNKVPEITIWFWIIKILCTTVGESFADWINMTLGVGLNNTALIFTAVFVVVLTVQMRLNRYQPFAYWLTVVVVSVTGTLYTDILTDTRGVPLALSTAVFSALLALVFGIWYVRERTLSIHSIVTFPREAFYWLTVLVTFALGTAAGDWTLDLTGWGPGTAMIMPITLIAVVALGWKLGGHAVLAFWLAYILTRPLGANLGDLLALPSSEKGVGLGTALTSVIFLAAILGTVIYLSVSRADVIEEHQHAEAVRRGPVRERLALGLYVVAVIASAFVLRHANQQPHTSALSEGEGGSSSSNVHLTPAQATKNFPASDIDSLRTIVSDTKSRVAANDQSGAADRATDLETAWDDAEGTLKPKDGTAWTFLDGEIDDVLNAVRASSPDPQQETKTLDTLLTSLG